jgi:hypothetical protein
MTAPSLLLTSIDPPSSSFLIRTSFGLVDAGTGNRIPPAYFSDSFITLLTLQGRRMRDPRFRRLDRLPKLPDSTRRGWNLLATSIPIEGLSREHNESKDQITKQVRASGVHLVG